MHLAELQISSHPANRLFYYVFINRGVYSRTQGHRKVPEPDRCSHLKCDVTCKPRCKIYGIKDAARGNLGDFFKFPYAALKLSFIEDNLVNLTVSMYVSGALIFMTRKSVVPLNLRTWIDFYRFNTPSKIRCKYI